MEVILIVEDEHINYLLLKEYLSEYGYITLWAQNGHEAIEYVRSKPDIKLVLMDLCMPQMDGIYATKLIKSIRAELPVVAQTAYLLNNIQTNYEEHGFSAFMSKPFNKHQLIDIVKELILQ
jgi:CheY-like chemotaxis protein